MNCHRVLNRVAWCPRVAARLLPGLLVAAFVLSGSVVLGTDNTIARQRGKRIAGDLQPGSAVMRPRANRTCVTPVLNAMRNHRASFLTDNERVGICMTSAGVPPACIRRQALDL